MDQSFESNCSVMNETLQPSQIRDFGGTVLRDSPLQYQPNQFRPWPRPRWQFKCVTCKGATSESDNNKNSAQSHDLRIASLNVNGLKPKIYKSSLKKSNLLYRSLLKHRLIFPDVVDLIRNNDIICSTETHRQLGCYRIYRLYLLC